LCRKEEQLRADARDASKDLRSLVVGKKPLDLLKRSNPEAFYYWYRIEKFREEREPIHTLDE